MTNKNTILADSERDYLAAVIKPWHENVTWICKYTSGRKFEHLYIGLTGKDTARLPHFPAGSMYTGMETDRQYTPKELGL